MDYKYSFTVFTPVYNRKDTIHRVYESLINQTFKDYEWIIVNDGSTDGVEDVLDDFKRNANFPVKIITNKTNEGKHFAWNKASDGAYGELFLPADSDDSFVCNTLERLKELWINIDKKERELFSGINVLCKDPYTENIIGNPYPESPMISNNLELTYKYKIRGEKWGTIRTDLMRKYKFPEIKTTRGSFVMNYLWFQLARNYKVLCVNEALRYYFQDQTERVTSKQKKDIIGSAPVIYFYLNWHINKNSDYIFKYESKGKILKMFLNLWRSGLLLGKNIKEIIKNITNKRTKVLSILTSIPGIILYLFTSYKLKKQIG